MAGQLSRRFLARAARRRSGRLRRGGPIGEGSGVDLDAIELGVVVHPDHWDKRFPLEAGHAAAGDLFERLGHDRVHAGVDPDNEKSLRASRRRPVYAGRRRALRARCPGAGYSALTTSITNHSVALPGIASPLPCAPYPNAGGIWSRTRLPTFTPVRPMLQPGMRPLSGSSRAGRWSSSRRTGPPRRTSSQGS